MTIGEALAEAVGRLEQAGIPFMITGSLASTFYGEPRATRDVDVVIDPTASSLAALVEALDADGWYVDRDAAFEALRDRTQFNAIGPDATKVDFIVRKDRPFSIQEFDRRHPVELLGVSASLPTLEDIIVAKLEWAVEADSERQLRDISSMLAVSGDALDEGYVSDWAAKLGLSDAWARIRDEWRR